MVMICENSPVFGPPL